MKRLPLLILSLIFSFTLLADGPGHGYHIGDQADDFSLMGVNDEEVSMANFPNAKGFIIVFTCNTCPYAVMYEDRIIALHDKFADEGFHVIAINPNDPEVKPDDNFEAMKVRAEEKDFQFPYLIDEGQQVYPKFGATRTPHVFVLDGNRTVRYKGAIDDNYKDANDVTRTYVEDAVMAIMNGEEVDPTSTKAIGCTIKVKS